MQNASLWRGVLGIEKTVVEDVEFDEDEQVLVAHVRPRQHAARRCGRCGRRCRGYDQGEGRRQWRGLDLGTIPVWLEADAPRVDCPEHGVVVAAVPWARHGAGHTYVFDEQVAWLATQCSRSAVTELMRIAWRTVGSIISRVWADVEQLHDRFAGLRGSGSMRSPRRAFDWDEWTLVGALAKAATVNFAMPCIPDAWCMRRNPDSSRDAEDNGSTKPNSSSNHKVATDRPQQLLPGRIRPWWSSDLRRPRVLKAVHLGRLLGLVSQDLVGEPVRQ